MFAHRIRCYASRLMSTRSPAAGAAKARWLGVAAVLGAMTALGIYAERSARPPSIVDVLPRGTSLVAEIDLATARTSSVARALFAGPLLKNVDEVRRICPKDPLDALERIAVAVPGGSAFGNDLALVAVGRAIKAEDVLACARAVIAARGGIATITRRGTFTMIQEGDGTRGVLAVRDSGPIAIGSGAYLASILDVADARAKSLRDDPVHDLSRRRATGAVATITFTLADELRGKMIADLPPEIAALARVSSATITIRPDEAQNAFALELTASCGDGACLDLGKVVAALRDGIARDPRVAALDLAPAVAGAAIEVEGNALRVRTALQARALTGAFQALPATGTLPK